MESAGRGESADEHGVGVNYHLHSENKGETIGSLVSPRNQSSCWRLHGNIFRVWICVG